MIQLQRIQPLNDRTPRRGDRVPYWIQASQREACNHALEYAVGRANELDMPVPGEDLADPDALPGWARATLASCACDRRPDATAPPRWNDRLRTTSTSTPP